MTMNRRNLFKSLAAAPLLAIPIEAEVPIVPEVKPTPGLPEHLYRVRTAQPGDRDAPGAFYDFGSRGNSEP